jgi:serine-type D-Ala-D-Ala carboxypeptidase/endopeptidase (penicillin-binding protein 4)
MYRKFLILVLCFSYNGFAQEYRFDDNDRVTFQARHRATKPHVQFRRFANNDRVFHVHTLKDNIDTMVRCFKGYRIGIEISSLTTGRVLYQHHAYENYIPASTLKLLTAISALSYLGPNFTFDTKLLTEKNTQIYNGTLAGNLYIKFSGNPSFSLNDLQKMFTHLKKYKITKVTGDVIIDDTAIDQSTWTQGRNRNDKVLCFAAPATATIINRNCFSLNLLPKRHNKPAIITVNRSLGVIIDNHVTTNRYKHTSLDVKPVTLSSNHYLVSGYLKPNKTRSIAIALQKPNLASLNILRTFLSKNHIAYRRLHHGKSPDDFRLLVENNSPPLSILVRYMLKKSDNLIADSLLKKLGEQYFGTQGTWDNGQRAIRTILKRKAQINFAPISLVDGSGLSLNNRINPNAFIQLLRYVYLAHPDHQLFFQALPRSGLDGTLKNRMGSVPDRVHAKTGSLRGVSGLVGYIRTTNNHLLAFSILINDLKPGRNRQDSYRLLEDKICTYLAKTKF